LLIAHDLLRRRLTNVDYGLAIQVLRFDEFRAHGSSPAAPRRDRRRSGSPTCSRASMITTSRSSISSCPGTGKTSAPSSRREPPPSAAHASWRGLHRMDTAVSTLGTSVNDGVVVVLVMALCSPLRIRHPEPTGSRWATPPSL